MTYTALAVVGLIVVILIIARAQLASTTVFEYERGLRFVRGRLRGVVEPALYRYLRAYTTIRKIDTRPVQVAVNGQEVLSRDGVAVKVSLTATYVVRDVRTAIFNAENYVTALYAELQQALRAAVSSSDLETLLENRAEL